MPMLMRVFVAAGLAATAYLPAARAQDMTTATVNGTTVWVGGGVQFLSLPDIRFVGQGTSPTDVHRQKNSDSDWLDVGGATGGGIETALGMWGGARVSGSIKGFWSNVQTDNRSTCHDQTCFVFDPAGSTFAFGPPTSGHGRSPSRDVIQTLPHWPKSGGGCGSGSHLGRPAPATPYASAEYRGLDFALAACGRGA